MVTGVRGVLGLDCSGVTHSCGLVSLGGGDIDRSEVDGSELTSLEPRSALRKLPGNVARLLQEAGLDGRGLACVGVTAGPGSFTGVRLGVTLARTAALVADCPLYGFDTLEVLAAQYGAEAEIVAVALDARRGEVYSCVFRSRGPANRPERLLETAARSPEDFAHRMGGFPLDLCVGSGFESYRDTLLGKTHRPRLAVAPEVAPSGLTTARLAARLYLSGDPGTPGLLPFYCREAEVQVDRGPRRPL